MKHGILLLLLLSIAFCSEAIGKEEMTSSPEAMALMKQVVAAYQSLSSYRDRGRTVQTLKSSPSDPATLVIEFTTVFERPSKFRFSWTSTENFGDGPYTSKEAIWSDGIKVWSSSEEKTVPVAEESFSMAVAGADGVTRGAAHEIFRLLTDNVSGFRFDQLQGLKIVRSETVSGVDCYVVRGIQYDVDNYELWVGKQDQLIRKGVNTQPDGNTATFERMAIVVDQPVPDVDFTLQRK